MHSMYREQTWGETDFVLFYQHHSSPILDYLRRQTRALEDAEDILVDVFMAARQAPQIAGEGPKGQVAWLYQVARNKLVDYYRHQGQALILPLEQAYTIVDRETAINPEQAFLQTETLERLQAAINRLPAQQQELLRLRFAEGLRCPQIAICMRKREGAVRTMLVRALQTLRSIYHINQEG